MHALYHEGLEDSVCPPGQAAAQQGELLGIPAGPQVGEAWNYLKELRLDRGPLSRDEATAELLAWWNARGGADV